MKQMLMKVAVPAVVAAELLILGGCAPDPQSVIHDSLSANNPARPGAPIGRPPVPPESLGIVPTGMAPTATPDVAPDPILPKMDQAWKNRWMPPEAEATQPADRAVEHERAPEGQYIPDPQNQEGQ